jgi:hypothetical protein
MRVLVLLLAFTSLAFRPITVTPVGQLDTGAAAEIVAYDAAGRRLFVINGASGSLDMVDIAEPKAPKKTGSIDLTPYGSGANSVAVRDGLVAVAMQADPAQAPGSVVFFDNAGRLLGRVRAGALPDMLTFTPDGSKLLVANEGEPLDYCKPGLEFDPEGSISIIDLSGGVANLTQAQVATAGFTAFNSGVPAGVRVFGPAATVAQDLEPEYIAVSDDSATAWVTLQENNALAVVDLASATVTALLPLGTKDHSLPENALDASDRDGASRIVPWPVHGMFQPDAIAAYTWRGETFLVTANEGDARDYECFSEEKRVKDLKLAATAFPGAAALQADEQLGRLKTTSVNGDLDGDGRWEEIYSYGARSFSIWTGGGQRVWDSGHDLELVTAAQVPALFNSNGPGSDSLDERSDDKGPEPEGVVLGSLGGRTYAFIGLERTGGIAVYDVTDPHSPFFIQYATNLTPDGKPAAGTKLDAAPEGLIFIPREDSPTGRALLVAAHEVSGTVTIFSIEPNGE